jgi:hypothetical protein
MAPIISFEMKPPHANESTLFQECLEGLITAWVQSLRTPSESVGIGIDATWAIARLRRNACPQPPVKKTGLDKAIMKKTLCCTSGAVWTGPGSTTRGVLPMLGYLECPTPYLFGIHRSFAETPLLVWGCNAASYKHGSYQLRTVVMQHTRWFLQLRGV